MPSNGSWQKVRFDEICKNISDRIDDPKQAKTDYYVGLEHLDSEDPKISRHGSPQDVSKTKLLFKPGHILFGKRNWYLRRLAVAQREGICSAHMLVLEPIEGKSTKEFLPLLMFSDDFYEKALMVSAGSMSPTIKWKDLAPLEFLIPSIEQQENILSLTHKIDDTISNAQNLLEKTKNYMVSRRELLLTRGIGHTKFKKVKWYYGKTIEIPEEWEFRKFNKITKQITDGSHVTPKYVNEGIPFLRVTDIQTEHIEWKQVKKINLDEHEELIKRCRPEKGDILYSKNGTIGIPKIVDWDKQFSIFVSICLIKPIPEIVSTYYLYLVLLSQKIKEQTQLRSKQLGVINLHLEEIRDFNILLPPKNEQIKIASIISKINEQITQQQSHLTNLKVLRKSILNSKLTKEKNVTN